MRKLQPRYEATPHNYSQYSILESRQRCGCDGGVQLTLNKIREQCPNEVGTFKHLYAFSMLGYRGMEYYSSSHLTVCAEWATRRIAGPDTAAAGRGVINDSDGELGFALQQIPRMEGVQLTDAHQSTHTSPPKTARPSDWSHKFDHC